MTDPTVYRDGYTRPLRIKARKGLHGELTGEYRPCLPAERDRMLSVAKQGDPDKTNAAAIKLLLDKLVCWSATFVSDDGVIKPATVNAFWLAHLAPVLYDRLYWIVLGVEASDPDDPTPEATGSEDRDYLDQIARADTGAADEKN